MLSIQSETLILLHAALDHLEECKQGPILASFEDCDYFRKHYLPPAPKPPIQQERPKAPTPSKQETRPALSNPIQSASPSEERSNVQTINPALESKPIPASSKPPKLDLPQPAPVPHENFDDLRKIWTKITSGAPFFEEIPSDETAKKIANRWKTKNATAEISILAYHEPPAQRALLEQIAKAIDAVFGPARIVQAEPIEKEKQWEAFLSVPHLKLTIACDYTLWQLGGLMHHYREVPAQGTRHLGSVPVFLLPDLSLYLKDPLLKRSLWKALCQTLS